MANPPIVPLGHLRRALIGAMLASALSALAPGAASGATPPSGKPGMPWWDAAWSHRQLVEVITPDPTGAINTAIAVVETGDAAAADGRDLRIVDAAGGLQRFEVVKGEAGAFEVHFEVANPVVTRYACYYGNPAAASAQQTWTKRLGGLRLTTKENTEQANAMSWSHMQRMVKQSAKTYGQKEWPLIDDTVNPFGMENENYLSIYEGKLYCPVTGTYTFITNSDDSSFLLIDGKVVAEWPGGHSPSPNWEPAYSGAVPLSQGNHNIGYYHVQTLGGSLARAGWRLPGVRRFEIIGEEYFARELRTEVLAREAREKPLNAFFNHEVIQAIQFAKPSPEAAHKPGEESAQRLVRVRFRDRATSAFGQVALWEWNFGDGSPPSREREPVHPYLGEGSYEVTLECRDDYGYVDRVRRRIRVASRQPQRVSVFMEAAGQDVVLRPAEPVQFQARFMSTADEPLDVTLGVEIAGANGELVKRWTQAAKLRSDTWETAAISPEVAPDLGEVRLRLEHCGLTIASGAVRIAAGRSLTEPLTPSNNGLEDAEGRRVLVRVGAPALSRAGAVLEKLRRGEPVKMLVVDDYLSPPLGDESATYYDILKGMLARRFPAATLTVARVGRPAGAAYPPLERLARVPTQAREAQADLVIVAGGIEDILNYTPEPDYERFLWALVERLQGVGAAQVLLVTPPPFLFNPAVSANYARAVKRVAQRTGADVADIYSALALMGDGWQELYRDENESDAVYYLSPRRKGQQAVAERLYEEIVGERP